jgi:hypothetical protein
MPLPERCIQEFRELWRQMYGEELSQEVAERQAGAMLAVLGQAFLPSRLSDQPKNNGPP